MSGNHEGRTSRSLEEQNWWYLENRHFKDMNRIDGEPMEFEWKIFPGITTLGLLEEDSKIYDKITKMNLSSSKEGSSSCRCSTTLNGENQETLTNVRIILLTLRLMHVLNGNVKRAKILSKIAETCLNLGFPQEQKKSYPVEEDLVQISLHGPMTWKVMQRKCVERCCELGEQKQPSNRTKSQLHAETTINSKKENWDPLENCQKYALKLF